MANTIDNVRNITDTDFQSAVLESDRPVLVDFWAEWCGPCRALGPVIEEIADDYDSDLSVVKVNVDESPATAAAFGVRSIPTVMLFRDGQPVESVVGVRPKAQFTQIIDRVVDRELA